MIRSAAAAAAYARAYVIMLLLPHDTLRHADAALMFFASLLRATPCQRFDIATPRHMIIYARPRRCLITFHYLPPFRHVATLPVY